MPSVVRPSSRCAVTMSGVSCQVTVSMPSSAWTITVASSTSASGMLTARSRRARTVSTAIVTMSSASVPAP
jgi:hypothetical protein